MEFRARDRSVGRQAFTGFARGFEAAAGQGEADIAGTGTPSATAFSMNSPAAWPAAALTSPQRL